jgi:hydroxypyruvate isomerase
MPPFSANISFMFAERPFLDRIGAAAAAGFPAVECHFPYEHPIPLMKETLAKAGIRLTGINTAPGGRAGDWGLACDAARRDEFRAGVEQALAYATGLDVPTIHVMAGQVEESSRGAARDAYLANMAWAAEAAAKAGRMIVTEPLNSYDRPGYFISRSDEVAGLIREIGHPALKLMFDVYHVQIMEGDVTRRLERHFDIIGHVQIAAVPSRAEPDEGEVNFDHLFKVLERLGYRGFVGAEYKPRGRTEDGLSWMKGLRSS